VILVIAVVVSTIVALLRGGRLARLADLRIVHAWLALAAVALQYPLVYDLLGQRTIAGVPLAVAVMAATYAMLLWFVWANRRLPGLPLLGVGLLLNLVVMAANGGWMPITPEALARLGRLSWVTGRASPHKVWSAKDIMLAQAQTRLWGLSDIFVLPAPFPVPTAFSVGDVLVALGVFWLLQRVLLPESPAPVARGPR
jgi:hypothetical protein